MAENNNQPSIGVQWPENNNPSRQANIKDLVGRVEEFVAFEAAAGAEEVDTMVPGVYGVNCHGLCACDTTEIKLCYYSSHLDPVAGSWAEKSEFSAHL